MVTSPTILHLAPRHLPIHCISLTPLPPPLRYQEPNNATGKSQVTQQHIFLKEPQPLGDRAMNMLPGSSLEGSLHPWSLQKSPGLCRGDFPKSNFTQPTTGQGIINPFIEMRVEAKHLPMQRLEDTGSQLRPRDSHTSRLPCSGSCETKRRLALQMWKQTSCGQSQSPQGTHFCHNDFNEERGSVFKMKNPPRSLKIYLVNHPSH